MEQDGKEFGRISEGAEEELLQLAANGELVLWAIVRKHAANLHAFTWAASPKQSNRRCAACLVPIMPKLANELLGFPDAQMTMYLATDPSDCPDSHPLKDHYWLLDEPQPITRAQIYCRGIPAKLKTVPVVETAIVTQNKLRRNTLDPAIDKAVQQAGSDELAAVYLKLKAMALNEETPFTGALDGDALCYTDDGNNLAKFTKNALGKRLKRRQTPLAAVSGQ